MKKESGSFCHRGRLQSCARIPAPQLPGRGADGCFCTLVQIEGNGIRVLGALDQHLYPYFKKDLEDGKIDLAKSQELLDCLWLKLNEIVKCWDTEASKGHAGFPMTQNVTAGGILPDGKDATNELTYLFMNTQDHIRLGAPQFIFRVHPKTPERILHRACEIIKNGGGMPALFSDEVVMESLVNAGVPENVPATTPLWAAWSQP
jgi:formate C-acetyltransferase